MTSDIYRVACYEALRPLLEEIRSRPAATTFVAEVAGRALLEEFGFAHGTYLARPRFDLMLPYTWKAWYDAFDLVLADFVLEHVPDPRLAVDALREILRPGGWGVVTTAFLFPIHDAPTGDYFRFSPAALTELFREGWEEVTVGSWGSRAAATSVLRWQENQHDADLGRQLRAEPNDPDHPVIVWATARRASGRASPRSVP